MAVKVSAQAHTLQIGGETVTVKNVPVQVVINSDFIITTKIVYDEVQEIITYGTAWLYINTEFRFGMKIKFYKIHLDMVITKSDGLTTEAGGLMGRHKLC